jgi:predicted flap endonuclease-1-like 5' DNA nuclease
MGLQIDRIRSAMIEAGYEVQSISPQRAPDGRVKVVVTVLKSKETGAPVRESEPEQMIAQPARELVNFRNFEQIPGIGPATSKLIRRAGITSLAAFEAEDKDELRRVLGHRTVDLIEDYLRQHDGDKSS